MGDVPAQWGDRLRELSFGPYYGSMWRWTYHDGSTWVSILRVGEEIVGWGCLTTQEEPYPVVGVFVDPKHRGKGYAVELVEALFGYCEELIEERGIVYASAHNWPRWPALIEGWGCQHVEWD